MFQALVRTITELLDSKKAAYSFVAAIGASVLHLYFDVSVQDALLLVSPLGVATISQAHVDAAAAKSGAGASSSAAASVAPALPATAAPVTIPTPPPAADAVATSPSDADVAKTDG